VWVFPPPVFAASIPVEYLKIQSGPRPEIIAEDGKAKIIPGGYIKRRLRLGVPSIKEIVIGDKQYIYITEKWFDDVISWTAKFIQLQTPQLDLQKTFPIGYEETFALLASNFANLSVAKRYNIKSSVLIGLLISEDKKAWGAIPGDGKTRIYVIGLTEKGGIIYDLKTHQRVLFENFPNFDSILGVMF